MTPDMQALQDAKLYTILVCDMDIQQNVSLCDHSTMRLGGNARYLVNITDRTQIAIAVNWAAQQSLPVIMIGHDF